MDDCEKCKILREIIDGQNTLLACYRLGTHKGVDAALDKIENAKYKLDKLEKASRLINKIKREGYQR